MSYPPLPPPYQATIAAVVAIAFLGCDSDAAGQAATSPAPAATAPQAVGPESTKSPADLTFEPIARDMIVLFSSLRNKGGVAAADQPVIRALRDRAAAFGRQFPKDVRGPATELQLSRWLKDDDLVESLYARILELAPENDQIRSGWVRRLYASNRYAEALSVLQVRPPDPVLHPEDALVYADCLFAEHKFQQSLEVVNQIPIDAFMVNPQVNQQFNDLKKYGQEYLTLWPAEQAIRAREEAADDLPRVIMVTARGSITLELFESEAPNTVANFISLADVGFYNGTKFHRVIANFMAQGGDPNTKTGATGTPGEGDPGYYIPDEYAREDHRNHFAGTLAMARTSRPNSGGCQFYITVTPTPPLNGQYTVFGRVLDGLDVVRTLKPDDVLEMATVIGKRDHDYKPSTLPLTSPATQPAIDEVVKTPPPPPPGAVDTSENPARPEEAQPAQTAPAATAPDAPPTPAQPATPPSPPPPPS